jgi:hypothetical protein
MYVSASSISNLDDNISKFAQGLYLTTKATQGVNFKLSHYPVERLEVEVVVANAHIHLRIGQQKS